MKPVFYFHVNTSNRGDQAIKKSIVDAIHERVAIPLSFFNVKYEELHEDRIINQLNTESSGLMIAGSGLYSNYNTSSGWYFPCKTELYDKIKVPIILMGIGCNNNLKGDIFNGPLTEKAKESIRKINSLAEISTVRDFRTCQILEDIGVTNYKLMLDPACFLRTPRIPKERRVAINIAQHAPALGRYDGDKIQRQKNLMLFAQISHYLIRQNYEVVFIAHDALEQSLINDLTELVPTLKSLNTDDLDVMMVEYAKCQLSISVKMHSSIMSFAAGTPPIHLFYDEKGIEFLKMIEWGYGQSIFDADYQRLRFDVDKILAGIESDTKYIQDVRQNHQPEFDRLIDQTCKLLTTTN